jgi:hypothetical protein
MDVLIGSAMTISNGGAMSAVTTSERPSDLPTEGREGLDVWSLTILSIVCLRTTSWGSGNDTKLDSRMDILPGSQAAETAAPLELSRPFCRQNQVISYSKVV